MTTDRRFSRFSKSPATAAFSVTEIPGDGVCLSAFVIVTEAHDPRKVLMGKSVDLGGRRIIRSEEHTSELQSQSNLVCRLLLEKKNMNSWNCTNTSLRTTLKQKGSNCTLDLIFLNMRNFRISTSLSCHCDSIIMYLLHNCFTTV